MAGLVVVEFVGTPGAGKTTAAAAMTEVLRARGVTARSMVEAARPHAGVTTAGRWAAALPTPVRDPVAWQVYRWHGWREGRVARRSPLGRFVEARERGRPLDAASHRHTLGWFFRLAGRLAFLERTAGRGTDEVLVVDDGFLHRSVALHASPQETPDPAAVAAFVDLLPEPALAVHVRAPVQVCAARVRARGVWQHRAGWTDRDLQVYLEHAETVVEAAVARARARGWAVVDVDNTVDGPPSTPSGLGTVLAAAAERLAQPAAVVAGGAAG